MNNLPPKLRQTVDRASTIDIDDGDEATKKRIHVNIAFRDFLQLVLGGIIVAFGVALFIAPHNIAPGGASGIAIIIANFVAVPIGITMLIINIPAFFLGYRRLGGRSFLIRSVVSTLAYNLTVDVIGRYVPSGGLTDEMILNAIYGGIVGGIGVGIIYRAGGIAGAGGVATRLLRQKLAWPMSTTKLITNGLVVLAAGFVFGWEAAMFSLISFFISGAVADFVLEGPDLVQTALIITDKPDRLSHALSEELERGITRWGVQGYQRRNHHTALYCTVTRPQVSVLKNIVAGIDDDALVIIGQGHEAIGEGFKSHKWHPPIVEKIEKADDK